MELQTPIAKRLSDALGEVRATALADLLQPGADPSPHLERVGACVSDPSESLRLAALPVLGRIGAPAASYLAAALDLRQPDNIRATAAAVIAGIGPPAVIAVRGLCRCLTSPDPTLRDAAAVALAKIGEAAVPSLRLMLQFSAPETVAAAVGALAFIGPPAAATAPELEALAARSPQALRLACAAALARVTGDPRRGLPVLLEALGGRDPQARKTAAEKISELREAAHPALRDLLRCTTDPDGEVRAAAVLTLGRIRAPHSDTVPHIIARLNDPVAEVRYNSIVVLASYGAEARSALADLRACLDDPVEKVAKCAQGAMERIESPKP
jgi:HEAT repeat protein